MKFTTIREDKNHRVHVTNRSEEWFIEKIQKDTATGLMKGYRHFLSYSSGIGSYLRMSEIPSLCMSCELRRSNEGQPEFGRWNGLVTLEVHELGSVEACDAVKRAAMQLPSTWAAMVGADGQSVVILVRVEPSNGHLPVNEEDAEAVHFAAYEALLPLYDAVLSTQVTRIEPHLRGTILLPYDESPLINREAVPFRVDSMSSGSDIDYYGNAQSQITGEREYRNPDMDAYLRHVRLYHRAVNIARQKVDKEECSEEEWLHRFLTAVATELCSYDMSEEEAVCVISNQLRYSDTSLSAEEAVRTIVSAVYAQDRAIRRRNPEPPITDLMHTLIYRINTQYVLQRNTIMGYVEYRPNNKWRVPWQPVTDEVVNTITTDMQLSGLNVWERDVRRYIYSTRVRPYNPVDEYLSNLTGKWDGRDYIRELAATVPTKEGKQWADWFHTWFLGMVYQWRNRRKLFGNSVVPVLISPQGWHKSTFCKNLLPPELDWGYIDNLPLAEERPVHQAMAQMLLINLDEFNSISPKVQEGKLKNYIQLASVKVKRPYGKRIEEVPRLASFIATTNMIDTLTDPSGSRRFICIQVTGSIDVSRTPNYTQLYAQAVAELDMHVKHWFEKEETDAIMEHNRQFQSVPSAIEFFSNYFEPGTDGNGEWMTAVTLITELKRLAGAALKDIPTTRSFGRILTNIPGLQFKNSKNGRVYLVRPVNRK